MWTFLDQLTLTFCSHREHDALAKPPGLLQRIRQAVGGHDRSVVVQEYDDVGVVSDRYGRIQVHEVDTASYQPRTADRTDDDNRERGLERGETIVLPTP